MSYVTLTCAGATNGRLAYSPINAIAAHHTI